MSGLVPALRHITVGLWRGGYQEGELERKAAINVSTHPVLGDSRHCGISGVPYHDVVVATLVGAIGEVQGVAAHVGPEMSVRRVRASGNGGETCGTNVRIGGETGRGSGHLSRLRDTLICAGA